MYDFKIRIVDLDKSTPGNYVGVWVDVKGKSPDVICEEVRSKGLEPHIVFDSFGFEAYLPRYIEEACELYTIYLDLNDPNIWPLFIEWYKREQHPCPKNSVAFKESFLGIYRSVSRYVREELVRSQIIQDHVYCLPGFSWNPIASAWEQQGIILVIRPPKWGDVGVFKPWPEDRPSKKIPDNLNDSTQTPKPGGQAHEHPTSEL